MRSIKPSEIKQIFNGILDKKLTVWWYGRVFLNQGQNPCVEVLLKEEGTSVLTREISIKLLNFFPLGSVWHNGVKLSDMNSLGSQTFRVSFKENTYKQVLVKDLPILNTIHYVTYGACSNKSSVQIFSTSSNQKVIIPSQVLFNRLYGYSSDLKRRIVTKPIDVVLHECLEPLGYTPPSGEWHVVLRRIMRDLDTVQLASMSYDPYARDTVGSVHQNLVAQAGSGAKEVFIHAKPWWEESTALSVKGIPLDDTFFLALRIEDVFSNLNEAIKRIRTNHTLGKRNDENDGEFKPLKRQAIEKDDVTIDQDATPDTDSPVLHVVDSTFNMDLQCDIEKILIYEHGVAGKKGSEDVPDIFSANEASGTGKGVGKLDVSTKVDTERISGSLSGIWEELRTQKRNGKIANLYLCTSKELFIEDEDVEELMLVPLKLCSAFDETLSESKLKRILNWPYLSKKEEIVRGVLIVKVVTNSGKEIYFMETQRKNVGGKEEALRGFSFTLATVDDFLEWQQKLVTALSQHCGVITPSNLKGFPGLWYKYNHVKASSESDMRPYERIVTRVLKELGD